MRASHIAVRAALVLGAAGAGVALWSAADPTAAHADHRPAAAEQPGGLLGNAVQLPEQAAHAAQDVIDQAAPGHTDEPAGDGEPAKDTDDPRDPEPTPTQTTPPTTPTGDAVDDVMDGVEVVGAAIPTPSLPTSTAPAAPLPVEVLLVIDVPVSAPAPVELPRILPGLAPAPAGLPVVIGPLPHRILDDGIHVPAPAAAHPVVAECVDPAPAPERRTDRHHGGHHRPPAAGAVAPSPGRPCPGTPGGPGDQACALASVPAHTTYGADHLLGDTATALVWPALHRLYELRPRSAIPPSRVTHPEPGPA